MGLLDFLGKGSSGGLSVDETLLTLNKGPVLVDVRTQRGYEAGHAPGARPVDQKLLADNPLDAIYGDEPLADHDAAIVVMCDGLRSRHRRAAAARAGPVGRVAGGRPARVGEGRQPRPPRAVPAASMSGKLPFWGGVAAGAAPARRSRSRA